MDTNRLDLNLLLTLEAVLSEQNVTRAAARLHRSQPAVSAQLARLRSLFGDPLLVPAGRGMVPTPKALELLQPLRQALDQVRAAVGEHQAFAPRSAEMTVSIAATDYVQAAVLAPLLLPLSRKAPGLRLALRHLDTSQLEAQMARGEVDLALLSPPAVPPTLHYRHLFDEQYVMVGRRNNRRMHSAMSVAEFARLQHVIVSLRGGEFRTPVDDALAALRRQRRVVVSAASFLVLLEIVEQSNLVALVPRRLVQDRTERLKLVECPFVLEGFAVGMVWHGRNHAHAAQRWLRDALVRLTAASA